MHDLTDFTDDEKMAVEIYVNRLITVIKEISTLRGIQGQTDKQKKIALLCAPLTKVAWELINDSTAVANEDKEEAFIRLALMATIT